MWIDFKEKKQVNKDQTLGREKRNGVSNTRSIGYPNDHDPTSTLTFTTGRTIYSSLPDGESSGFK